ncbi:MAG: ParA family protein [Alphaproteobacteria bacterium]|nr:ParA family protein [Alphaproteobacteria bacterium]
MLWESRVIAVATSKGGAGKSTSVCFLALYFAQQGLKVGILDCDPNGTLTRWHAKGGALSNLPIISEVDEKRIISSIASLVATNDIVLVDCPGFNSQVMVYALGVANLVLVPVMTDEANLFEAIRTKMLVDWASSATKRPIEVRAFLSRIKSSNLVSHSRGELEKAGVQMLNATVADRIAFQESTYFGSSPLIDYPGSGAARDVIGLATEVAAILDLDKRSHSHSSAIHDLAS